MSKAKDFRDLFIDQLQDIHNAETQLIEALPEMAKAATTEALKKAFIGHLEETKGHVQRLEDIFRTLDERPPGVTCTAMMGIIAEGHEIAGDSYTLEVRDAGLIAAAQRVEHYEMAAYGTARSFALQLDDQASAKLLERTLKEEGDCNKALTHLAQSGINQRAAEAQPMLQDA